MISSGIVLKLADLIFGFIEIVLGMRVFLKLLGASSSAPFVHWVYETSQPLLTPFQGMFRSSVLNGGFVIEPSTLFALLAYALIGYAINELVAFVSFSVNRYYGRLKKNKNKVRYVSVDDSYDTAEI